MLSPNARTTASGGRGDSFPDFLVQPVNANNTSRATTGIRAPAIRLLQQIDRVPRVSTVFMITISLLLCSPMAGTQNITYPSLFSKYTRRGALVHPCRIKLTERELNYKVE